ncbi:hypothetical protein Tco_1037004 [Tanacetum coccineum]
MSTPVFVDPEISTQVDGAQRPRVPVPFPEDPYEAIRQAYLVESETLESPHTVASPTPLPDSTPSTRHAKDLVDSDTSGARSTPSDSTAPLSPDHPLTHASSTLVPILRRTTRMAMRVPPVMSPGLFASTAEVAAMSDSAFLEDDEEKDDEEEGEEEEDKEVKERDEGLAVRDEGPSMRVESLGLGGDAAVPEDPERPERVSALRQPTLTPSIVPLCVSSPMIPLTVPSPIASPTTAETDGFLTELGARVEMSGAVRDEIFSQRYRFRSQTDAQRAALWHAISDTQRENHELRIHIIEERRARLDLTEIVDSMRRWQEPRGDV